jgi:cell division protein FtsW
MLTYDGKQKEETKKSAMAEKAKSFGRFGTWVKRVQDFMYAKTMKLLTRYNRRK